MRRPASVAPSTTRWRSGSSGPQTARRSTRCFPSPPFLALSSRKHARCAPSTANRSSSSIVRSFARNRRRNLPAARRDVRAAGKFLRRFLAKDLTMDDELRFAVLGAQRACLRELKARNGGEGKHRVDLLAVCGPDDPDRHRVVDGATLAGRRIGHEEDESAHHLGLKLGTGKNGRGDFGRADRSGGDYADRRRGKKAECCGQKN